VLFGGLIHFCSTYFHSTRFCLTCFYLTCFRLTCFHSIRFHLMCFCLTNFHSIRASQFQMAFPCRCCLGQYLDLGKPSPRPYDRCLSHTGWPVPVSIGVLPSWILVHHTVLGLHTKTGLLTLMGLGSSRPTLQHWRIPGQVPVQTGKAQVLQQRKTTMVVIIGQTSNRKKNRHARSCESRSQNRRGFVSRGTAQRNNTTSWESLYCRRWLRGPR